MYILTSKYIIFVFVILTRLISISSQRNHFEVVVVVVVFVVVVLVYSCCDVHLTLLNANVEFLWLSGLSWVVCTVIIVSNPSLHEVDVLLWL